MQLILGKVHLYIATYAYGENRVKFNSSALGLLGCNLYTTKRSTTLNFSVLTRRLDDNCFPNGHRLERTLSFTKAKVTFH